MEQENPGSAVKAKQGRDASSGETRTLWWAEASIWTDRMVSALENGVKGGKWFSLRMDRCLLRGHGAVHPTDSPCGSETLPMRKPATGEPCAGEQQARFGGRGGQP